MTWLLPITLVLLATLLVAGIHWVFVRWLARQPEPESEPEQNRPDQST